MKPEVLRMFPPAAFGPAENMAIDETLFLSLIHRGGPPFFRFYRWVPPTLSFGYFQKIERLLDVDRAEKSGLGLVRRASGGKMVFHADEWTFSLAMPISAIQRTTGAGEFLGYFRALMEPLVRGLREFALDVELRAESQKGSADRIHCYSANVGHSVFLGEKKLIGAAGIAKEGVFMIHGSIPISLPPVLPDLFSSGIDSRASLGMAHVSEALTPDQVSEIPLRLAQVFGETFCLSPNLEGFSSSESDVINLLAGRKYSDLFWPGKDLTDLNAQIRNRLLPRLP